MIKREPVIIMRQKSYNGTSSLYLIPTPIGNMEDITLRAINILKSVDLILCEDTRVTSELLFKLDIKKKLIRSDDHNEEKVKELVLEKLQEGLNIGLVTDRGTPIISDPGYKIVEFIAQNGYNVISLPGPTAFVPALTMSGINPSPFIFYGFLNSKKSKREIELKQLQKLSFTIIFYEAPHRIKSMLESMLQVFGDRKIVLCREISKKFEEVIRDNISNIIPIVDELKGEMVVVVEGNRELEDFSMLSVIDHIKLYLDDGMTEKEAIKKVAVERDVPKSIIYRDYHIDK